MKNATMKHDGSENDLIYNYSGAEDVLRETLGNIDAVTTEIWSNYDNLTPREIKPIQEALEILRTVQKLNIIRMED